MSISICSLSQQSKSIKDYERQTSSQQKPLFNSRLFIDMEINKEIEDLNFNSENNTEDSENSFQLEENNYLSNELIEELDFCNTKNLKDSNSEKGKDYKINNMNSNSNIINSLLSLVDNGYIFKPKNFKPIYDNKNNQNLFNKNNNNNYDPKQSIKINNLYLNNSLNCSNFRDKKKDWVCTFCNNLNYSFRTKCNRCKVNKEVSEKRKIFL
jgi:hypothetical protein